jgi:carboxyl-terminal processing protease
LKRLACLVGFAAISILAFGCAGRSHDRTPPPPTPAGLTGASSPDPGAPPEEQVLYAFRLLLNFYVDAPQPNRLLEAARDGALEALAPAFEPPPGLRLDLPGDIPGAEAAFKGYFRALLQMASAPQPDRVARASIEAMADSLGDDHTYYMQPDAYDLYLANETVGLSYSGVRRPNGLLVWYVYADGPADRAGLRAGDTVVTIDGRLTADEDPRETNPFTAGVPAVLQIERPGVGRLELTATPRRTERRILDWRAIGDIGYLRLYRFPPPTLVMPNGESLPGYLDFALADLRQQGVKAFILDLRNNPGGSEVVAANVAGRLGLSGPLVENRRRGGGSSTIDAIGDSGLDGLPLAVLINENSSSSSELVVASLEQAGLARVFGQKTGGIVNTARAWSVAGGGLFITTERAFAGARASYLDGQGVAPDETVSLSPTDLTAGHDTQLERALEWLRSRLASPMGSR